ncbi:MAG TPA: glycosyltransferase family 4 protein [Vicinamibacterales bacterium]|nr:glycosyltransferase family 4 protein [Vicinamibacterales bacterium]
MLTIGHSYVIAGNRRLAHEMAVQGRGRWEVTAAAPSSLPADLRNVALEPIADEACALQPLGLRLASSPHVRFYDRRLRPLLSSPWDVVHVWEEPYVAACAQIASLAPAGATVIPATFQNIVKTYPPPFGYFERRVMQRAAGWVAFGETVHAAQRSKPFYASKPSRIIPPGVDVVRYRPDSRARRDIRVGLGWDDSIPVVGYLGRFVPEKGLSLLMRALKALETPWRALFIGGGSMETDLRAFAGRHPGRVQVLTDVVHDAVPAHLNAMDLLCAPSQTTARWREQFGRMLIEAMACGIPIVASDSGEIPHVVGDAAIVVAEGAAEKWTGAIAALLGDHARRRELSLRGQARANERYAWPVVARAHLAFFEELM